MFSWIKITHQRRKNRKKQHYIEKYVNIFMSAHLSNAQRQGYHSLSYNQWTCAGLFMIGAMDRVAQDIGAKRDEYALESTKRLLTQLLDCREGIASEYADRILNMSAQGFPYALTDLGNGCMREFLDALQRIDTQNQKEADSLINESNTLTRIIKNDVDPSFKPASSSTFRPI